MIKPTGGIISYLNKLPTTHSLKDVAYIFQIVSIKTFTTDEMKSKDSATDKIKAK